MSSCSLFKRCGVAVFLIAFNLDGVGNAQVVTALPDEFGYRFSAPPVITPPAPAAVFYVNSDATEEAASKSGADAESAAEKDLTPKELHDALDARLKELEESFSDQEKAAAKAKEDAKKKPTFKINGRIHADYWSFLNNSPGIGFFEHSDPTAANFGTDPEDRFAFRRIRMEFGGDIPDNMLWRMQIDFNEPDTPQYKDVYLGWTHLPNNQTLLIGNQKRPLGLDHLNSSRYNVFMERPLVVESFNEDARRVGMCMYGHNDQESVNWRYGLYNLENTSESGRYVGDSMQMGGYGRMAFSPYYDEASDGRGYYHFALAGAVARPDGNVLPGDSNSNAARFRTRPEARSDARWIDTRAIAGADWYETLALESMLNLGPWQFTGEYMATFLQRDNVTTGTGPDVAFHGFYVYASYFLTGEHMAYERNSGTLGRAKPFENFFLVDRLKGGTGQGLGAWQIAARYDYLDLSSQDILGGIEQDFTLGLNWYWNAYSKLQTNLIFGDIDQHRAINGFTSGDFWILGTRFACDF
ncbi:MAG: ATPase [Planctomycetales bacterium]|nr:ATPase [Planctomycetales bacterium]